MERHIAESFNPVLTGRIRKYVWGFISLLFFGLGLLLLSINLYGTFTDIRLDGLDQVDPALLRFENDDYLTYEESISKLNAIKLDSKIDYALKANAIVQQSLTHRSATGDVLGPTPQARIRHRHRDLPAMRRPAARHCQHRGTGGDRADSQAPWPEAVPVDPAHPSRAPPRSDRLI